MHTITDPTIAAVLDELHTQADAHDEVVMPQVFTTAADRGASSDADIADLLADAYMPIDRTNGAILHALAAARPGGRIVEFGTSHGLSTIYLAAALGHDEPPVIATELEPAKVEAAAANLTRAGLANRVDLRAGDAFGTLADLDEPIGMLFLDGWKGMYLPLLQMLEPKLVDRAMVVADDITLLPDLCAPYLDHVRAPETPYVSAVLPFDDGLELSVHIST